jgi:hypothetical protein
MPLKSSMQSPTMRIALQRYVSRLLYTRHIIQRRFQSQTSAAASPSSIFESHQQSASPVLQSTLQYTPKKDFSTRVEYDNDYFALQKHWNALLSAAEHAPARSAAPVGRAREMTDLIDAAEHRDEFDKMLLLVNHGEGGMKRNDTSGIPFLTGRGMGQALDLSRRTARFCTTETGLCPALVVVAPLATSIQTALHAFPYHSPAFRTDVPWICHGDLVEEDHKRPESYELLSAKFPGLDLSLCHDECDNGEDNTNSRLIGMVESKRYLLGQSDRFLEWIHQRDERVILGTSPRKLRVRSFCG